MSLKCSIFGCDYGETEIERGREEDGNEVIVTVRETETCSRCGDVHLVSENKEVTTMETAADIVADDLDEDGGDEPADEPPAPETPPKTEGPGAAIPDAETESAVTTTAPEPNETDEMPSVDGQDDAVILDDDASEQAETDPDEDTGREPGQWPEEPEADDEWEQPTEAEPAVEQETPEITSTGSAVTVPEGEFHCPECGYATPVESSSLREGDYCPECHRGSLRHNPDAE